MKEKWFNWGLLGHQSVWDDVIGVVLCALLEGVGRMEEIRNQGIGERERKKLERKKWINTWVDVKFKRLVSYELL